METFFIVMKDQAQPYMGKRHQSEINARLEAERLARKEVGYKFFLMKAVACVSVETPPVTWDKGEG
uniref:Uncharacterized protein n=1 Tax=viral metagenome TaxID=1070528 RepID=A0A6M3J2B1_9ZZZZ